MKKFNLNTENTNEMQILLSRMKDDKVELH